MGDNNHQLPEKPIFYRIDHDGHVDMSRFPVKENGAEEKHTGEKVAGKFFRPGEGLFENVTEDDLGENECHHKGHQDDHKPVQQFRNFIVDRYEQFEHYA